MKDLYRNVSLLCPLCGNDLFESMDSNFDNPDDAPDDVELRCADCDSVYTKQELLEENSEIISSTIKELEKEVVEEIKKDLERVFGNGSIRVL